MEDGNNGGRRYIHLEGTRTKLLPSKSSGSFILMGLTAETGEPVLCICILAAKSLSVTERVQNLDKIGRASCRERV